MPHNVQLLNDVWNTSDLRAHTNTKLSHIQFNQILSTIVSAGHFYFYVIDFFDMRLSHVSANIKDIHGFDPDQVVFNDILGTIHPDDVAFVAACEKSIMEKFYNEIGFEKLTSYKISYSFRSKMAHGGYEMINHQALMLSLDNEGGFGKSLNIHTSIHHLTTRNNYTYSLIGLNGLPSYMNIDVMNSKAYLQFTKREIEIIRLLSAGDGTDQIADKLKISSETVKKHRKNMLKKTQCSNTAQLVAMCVQAGLI